MSATRPSANAVCPVEHAIVMNKRSKVTTSHPEELFEELYIDPVLYVPKEETFPVLLKYIDVTRYTHTDLDVLQEKRIDDYWNVD